jgi:hypothetical protein
MNLGEFHRHIGAENLQPSLEAGLKRAHQILADQRNRLSSSQMATL